MGELGGFVPVRMRDSVFRASFETARYQLERCPAEYMFKVTYMEDWFFEDATCGSHGPGSYNILMFPSDCIGLSEECTEKDEIAFELGPSASNRAKNTRKYQNRSTKPY
jgi:hypothetical protein